MLVASRPVQALAGTAIVLLGLPVYAVIWQAGRGQAAWNPKAKPKSSSP